VKEVVVHSEKWLRLTKLYYLDEKGQERVCCSHCFYFLFVQVMTDPCTNVYVLGLANEANNNFMKKKEWDCCERTTRHGECDGVDIIARVKYGNREDDIVLCVQYRPPMRSYCVE
jgi:hypothetical protein